MIIKGRRQNAVSLLYGKIDCFFSVVYYDIMEVKKMDMDKKICKCKKVTYGDVVAAMEKGATSFKEVKKATGAGSKCGDCKKKVKKFMEEQEVGKDKKKKKD